MVSHPNTLAKDPDGLQSVGILDIKSSPSAGDISAKDFHSEARESHVFCGHVEGDASVRATQAQRRDWGDDILLQSVLSI